MQIWRNTKSCQILALLHKAKSRWIHLLKKNLLNQDILARYKKTIIYPLLITYKLFRMKLRTFDQFTIYIVKYYKQSNGDLLAGIHILRLLISKIMRFYNNSTHFVCCSCHISCFRLISTLSACFYNNKHLYFNIFSRTFEYVFI